MNRDRLRAFHGALKKVREPSQKAHTYALWFTAIATFSLAIGAFWNTCETRRLADLTTEQFRIKSYPDFLINAEPFNLDAAASYHKFRIYNKGEITAHRVTFLIVDIYERDHGLFFKPIVGTYYVSDERMTAINFETKIWREAHKTLEHKGSYPKGYDAETLRNCLLFIKFRVPYDTKYRYESFGFILQQTFEEEDEKTHTWQPISSTDMKSLRERYVNLSSKWGAPVEEFFVDYATKQVD
jgi:hypothetical protein